MRNKRWDRFITLVFYKENLVKRLLNLASFERWIKFPLNGGSTLVVWRRKLNNVSLSREESFQLGFASLRLSLSLGGCKNRDTVAGWRLMSVTMCYGRIKCSLWAHMSMNDALFFSSNQGSKRQEASWVYKVRIFNVRLTAHLYPKYSSSFWKPKIELLYQDNIYFKKLYYKFRLQYKFCIKNSLYVV